MDNTTQSELIPPSVVSFRLPSFMDSQTHHILRRCFWVVLTRPTSLPTTPTGSVERVTAFKLLGINFEANLSWSLHINTFTAKASKRLYFLNQLKRATNSCISTSQLQYTACPRVLHTGLVYAITRAQTEQLESIKLTKACYYYTHNFSFHT